MTNSAWECPRCKRINAPFNPSCFCKDNDSKVVTPKINQETSPFIVNRCLICNGYHGNGIACMTLKAE